MTDKRMTDKTRNGQNGQRAGRMTGEANERTNEQLTIDDTDGQEIPPRPNEGAALTENRRDEEGPRFYYSRERRLSKAPASVRALYEDRGKPGFNLLRPLVSSRPNAILFGTMTALILITLVISLSGLGGGKDYRGNRITLSATRYEGAALVTLKKTAIGGEAYTGPLAISVSPAANASQAPAYPHRVVFSPRKTEEFSFSVPVDGPELLIELSGNPGDSEKAGSLALRIKTK
jgi:hypothetical protein